MAWLCLVPFDNSSLRVPKALRQQTEPNRRSRWCLPAPEWFNELVADVKGHDPRPVMVHIGPGHKYLGEVTTQWGPEGFLLWEFFNRPHDAFTFQILSVHSLQADAGMILQGGAKKLRPSMILARSELPVMAKVKDENHDISNIMYVPAVQLSLIIAGHWHTLLCRYSWAAQRGVVGQVLRELLATWPGWPDHKWVERLHAQQAMMSLVPRRSLRPLQSHAALAVATQIRAYATEMLQKCSGEEFHLSSYLGDVLHHLDVKSGMVPDSILSHDWLAKSSKKRWSASALAQAIAVCMHLRNRHDIRHLVAKALVLVSGEGLGTVSSMLDVTRIPSATVLCRAQLRMDAAWCCYWRQRLARGGEQGPLYLWADSSPQGGQDYLLSTLMGIDASELIPAFRSSLQLFQSTARLLTQPLAERSSEEALAIVYARKALADQLHEKLWFHRQIPVSVGKGDLEHKSACLVHKFKMEASIDDLPSIFSRVRGLCTDLGVEANLAKHMGLTVYDFMPHDDTGLVPDRPRLHNAVLASEVARDALGAVAERTLLPYCILSSGMCHIAHNMTAEVSPNFFFYSIEGGESHGLSQSRHRKDRRLRESAQINHYPVPYSFQSHSHRISFAHKMRWCCHCASPSKV